MRNLLASLLLFACTIATVPDARAQQGNAKKDYDLAADLGLSFMKANLTISGEQGGSVTKAQKKYSALWARLTGQGWSSAEIMAMNVGPACHNEAVLRGQKQGFSILGRIRSANGVKWPSGNYAVNYPILLDEGEVSGQGTTYSGTTVNTEMSTTLTVNRSGWLGAIHSGFDVMNLAQTVTWGMNGDTSYVEGGSFKNFRLVGDNTGWYNAAYTNNGFGAWELGETFTVDRIYCWNFNGYGIANVRGTPASYGTISVFVCALGGFGFIGCDQNTINIFLLSGDDSPALMVQISGYGRPSGGNITANLGKSETGRRGRNPGQVILWQRSPTWGIITIKAQQAIYADKVDAAFVMNTLVPSGGQILDVAAVSWNYNTIVQDLTNHKRWAAVDYRPYRFIWSSVNGNNGVYMDLTSGAAVSGTTDNSTDRLGVVANVATYNYTAGTPLYSITGP